MRKDLSEMSKMGDILCPVFTLSQQHRNMLLRLLPRSIFIKLDVSATECNAILRRDQRHADLKFVNKVNGQGFVEPFPPDFVDFSIKSDRGLQTMIRELDHLITVAT